MNHKKYIARYESILAQACQAYPNAVCFERGSCTVETHLVRLRQVRKYLIAHPSDLPSSLNNPERFTTLGQLTFWTSEDKVYCGEWKLRSQDGSLIASSNAAPTLNFIERDLTRDELQALFYCYNAGIMSVPTRLENQSPTTHKLITEFAQLCPAVGVSISSTHILLL